MPRCTPSNFVITISDEDLGDVKGARSPRETHNRKRESFQCPPGEGGDDQAKAFKTIGCADVAAAA